MLKTNEGKVDRGIRIVLGIVLSGLAFRLSGAIQIIIGAIGIIAFITGIFGFCALYRIFGISTNKKE